MSLGVRLPCSARADVVVQHRALVSFVVASRVLRVGGVWAWPLSRCFEWISVKSQQTFELSKRNCQADFDDHNDEDEDDKYQDGCKFHVIKWCE